MATILRDSQKTELSYTATSRKGNPAMVADPAWSSSNESVASVTASADGSSATVVAVGPVGTATITLTGDADLGAGVVPVRGELDIEVVAGNAAVFNITAADPTEQADSPPPTPPPEPTPEPTPAPPEPTPEPPA